ncbi:MAG TPA: hypothetical protein VHE35_25620 [Kofleriaceae bacterium]|nr:hypothetical protein [Kofleriaceae bacterium]
MTTFDQARAIADAVLLEGYALYPYRASAPKNRFRWTFGVLAPRAWAEAGGCEASWLEAQVLVAGTPTRVALQLRFFQIVRRRLEDAAGQPLDRLDDGERVELPWDEGLLRTVEAELDAGSTTIDAAFDGDRDVEALAGGRVVREAHPLTARLTIRHEPVDAAAPLARVTIRVDNTTAWDEPAASRERALAGAMASVHLSLVADGAAIVSPIDPPAWAAAAAAACTCTRTYPALIADDLVLCAPFVLPDRPRLAPESPGDLCDATEIDELLLLRTRTMTDEEKRIARATDARTRAIVDRADALADATMARLHGAERALAGGDMVPKAPLPAVGSKVRLLPARRTTDAQDVLYAGQIATVVEIREDVDGTSFVAVTVDADPAAELHGWYGRYRYYRPDEVEAL